MKTIIEESLSEEDFPEILEYCARYARDIMVVAAHATYGSENTPEYDNGLRVGIVHSLSPMFREVFDMDDNEQKILESALDAITESACVAVRSQAQTIGRA